MITPEDFDTVVRDTLHAVDGQMHPDAGMPARLVSNARSETTTVVPFGRRHSWIAPLTAAAAVVAVVATITVATTRSHRHTTPPATQLPTPHVTASPHLSASPHVSASPTATANAAGTCLTLAEALAIVSHERGGQVRLAANSPANFACSHGWAYLNFQGPNSPNTATVDLQYVHGQWIVGDRTIACGDANGRGTTPPAMDPALVRGGCGN